MRNILSSWRDLLWFFLNLGNETFLISWNSVSNPKLHIIFFKFKHNSFLIYFLFFLVLWVVHSRTKWFWRSRFWGALVGYLRCSMVFRELHKYSKGLNFLIGSHIIQKLSFSMPTFIFQQKPGMQLPQWWWLSAEQEMFLSWTWADRNSNYHLSRIDFFQYSNFQFEFQYSIFNNLNNWFVFYPCSRTSPISSVASWGLALE